MNETEKLETLMECYTRMYTSGIIKNKADMAMKIGVNRSVLSAAFNRDEKYLTENFIKKVQRMTDLLMNQSEHGTTNIHQSANGRNINQHAEAMNAEQFLKLLSKKDEQMDRLIKIIENLQNK